MGKFIIYPTANICKTLKHGKEGDINDGVLVTSDLILGERVHISSGVKIIGTGSVYIGDDSTIGPNCVIYTSVPNLKKKHHGRYDPKTEILKGNIHIGKNVFIGAGSIISQGTKIKDNSIIRAMSYI